MAAQRRVGAVERAVKGDIARIAASDPVLAGSGLAQTALALARELDDPNNSATSKSMVGKALMDALERLSEMAPPERKETELERHRRERSERRRAAGVAKTTD